MLSHVSHATIAAIQNTASKITPHTKQREGAKWLWGI
jgi:hypothetical protein